MKKIISISTLLIMMILGSCHDLSEINENPNDVPKALPYLLLTEIAYEAFQVEGPSPLFATRMIVKTDEENKYQFYKWDRGDFDDYGHLRQVAKMIEESKRTGEFKYKAIGLFFKAFYGFNLTLQFGDIPYSEALKGEKEAIYTPKYDSQEDVFKLILADLATASSLLEKSDKFAIKGDIIFNGNINNWIKLINSYKLKVLLTLSKKEGSSSINIKSDFAKIYNSGKIITDNSENAQIVFADAKGSRYSEYKSSVYGSGMYMCSFLVDKLKERKDPRLFTFATQTKQAKDKGLKVNDFNAYNGGNPIIPYGDVNDLAVKGLISKINNRFTEDPTNEPHYILSYSDVQFILAEASVRGWISSDVKKHYENGVKASFKFYQTYAKGYVDYLSVNNTEEYLKGSLVDFSLATTLEEKLKFILTQKYFTTFLQEGWSAYYDFLRTGYPEFTVKEGMTPPKRWIYPNDEYINNTKNVSEAIQRQFGGNDKVNQLPWWLK